MNYCCFIAILLAALAVSAQTQGDLQRKYSAAERIYKIRPSVIMTVKFDDAGQATEMRVERSVGADNAISLDKTFPSYLAKDIVDELAPDSERGAKGLSQNLSTRDAWANTEYYERVSITYWHRGCEEVNTNVIAIVIKWRR
jgi:hypothetical protein